MPVRRLGTIVHTVWHVGSKNGAPSWRNRRKGKITELNSVVLFPMLCARPLAGSMLGSSLSSKPVDGPGHAPPIGGRGGKGAEGFPCAHVTFTLSKPRRCSLGLESQGIDVAGWRFLRFDGRLVEEI